MSANGQKTTSRALCLSVFSEPCCRIGRRFFSRRHTRRGGGGGIRRDETKGNTKHHHLRRTTHKKEYLSRRSSTTYPQFENVAFHLDQKNADGEQSKRHEASHHVHRGPARHRVADRRGKPNQGALQGEHLFLSLRLSLSLSSAANCDDDDQCNTIRFKNSLSLFPLSLSLSPKNPLSVFLLPHFLRKP